LSDYTEVDSSVCNFVLLLLSGIGVVISIVNKQLERVCAQFSYRDVTVIKGILHGWSASTATTATTATTAAAAAAAANDSTTVSIIANTELLTPPRTPQYSSNRAASTGFGSTTSAATSAAAETPAPVTVAPVTDSAGLYEVVFAEPVLGITLVKQGGMPIVEVKPSML
jgi:hypothetical protein